MAPTIVALVCTLLCLASAHSPGEPPHLVVKPAGQDNLSKHLDITGKFSVCPTDVEPSGKITLECAVPGSKGPAQMMLNGQVVRIEIEAPFTINGDINGFAEPWTPPVGDIIVGCKTELGTFTWGGVFTCVSGATPQPSASAVPVAAGDVVAPTPSTSMVPSMSTPPLPVAAAAPPSTADITVDITVDSAPYLEVRSAGADIAEKRMRLFDGFNVCAEAVSDRGISVECVLSSGAQKTGAVTFTVDGATVKTEETAPYVISGDYPLGVAKNWTLPSGEVTVGCNAPGVGSASAKGVFIATCPAPAAGLVEQKSASPLPEAPLPEAPLPETPLPTATPTPSVSVSPVFPKEVPGPAPQAGPKNKMFETVSVTGGNPAARHEGCGVFCNGEYYIIGGRQENRGIWSFDPKTSSWTSRKNPGAELQHMQCVCVGKKIYIPGAWGGPFPTETPYKEMYVYDTTTNTWDTSLPNPSGNRLRGSAAVGVFDGTKIIVASGSTGGHGAPTTIVPYTDIFDTAKPSEGWRPVQDIPDPRDHTGGAVVGKYFCVAGGRDGSKPDFTFWKQEHNTAPINCFDLTTEKWKRMADLPTPRGGVAVGSSPCGEYLMVAGGEAVPEGEALFATRPAYKRVDLFDPVANKVLEPLMMKMGRHGTGLGVTDCSCGNVYVAAGAGNVGGSPELNDLEVWRAEGPRKLC